MRSFELEALIASWQLEERCLQSIIFDRSTPACVRMDCLIAFAELVTEMEAFVIEVKNLETIH